MSEVADPMALATACAETMWASDRASQSLGMVLESVTPGRARLSMAVRPDMVNGHDLCHGGLIAALADSAFAFACNSHGTVTVASGFAVEILEPARLGDLLVADAREVALRGRSGVYDVTVRCGEKVVAEFRGRSRSLGRPVLEEQR
ncbi:hydroxyphenylacetyl-CoA thioesterase PaaI [Nocardioides bizhenqiangii]|uniref:Hydroxyphenylacetyl-CoA thioesterase PaaI n=1 Tax=Nocardioides bizhenqiangii TaxID=3095076 RepID=A0ABZ0ZTI6_9ACTN|nr:hydroxyphenylacetyl-CoA thioesterase PaaI [Nocardioides sp. HM61]WQQ27580.1 hydroxyphenylacetyl-CoA thioesterase PaaI [Nocardioides sp. HM61]